jgi:hypothetical protein
VPGEADDHGQLLVMRAGAPRRQADALHVAHAAQAQSARRVWLQVDEFQPVLERFVELLPRLCRGLVSLAALALAFHGAGKQRPVAGVRPDDVGNGDAEC